jgi:multidrug resistance protein MdtO
LEHVSTYRKLAEFLRAELAFYPGRLSLILRIACACTISMAIIMAFRIPGAAFGAYYPLLLAHDSPRATLKAATRTGIVCIVGTFELLAGAMVLVGDPFTHLLWVLGNLLLVFFLISTLEAYDTALAFGLLVSSAISIWDQPVSAERRLTRMLFLLLSILIGCAVSVGVEYFFARTHSPDAVIDGIRARLMVVSEALQGLADGEPLRPSLKATLSRYIRRGTGELRERLAHAEYEATYKDQLSAALALSGRLIELTSHLVESGFQPAGGDSDFARSIANKIEWINTRLLNQEAPEWLDITENNEALLPTLVEIERMVELVAECFHTDPDEPLPYAHLPAPGEKPRMSAFVPDTFSNREHVRFAIRGTVSAMACYLAYMSVGWTGLNAAIATCILTALPNTGATRHKQLMRFSGMLVGACILGFLSQAVVLPQIDSIQGFAALFAAVVAIGAWVGTSSPRLSHAGAQLVLAFDLVNLNSFAMNPSLVPARDAVLGIVLGIAAMWLIYDHLWTKSTPEAIRELLLSGIRGVAYLELDGSSGSAAEKQAHLWAECEKLTRGFDKLRNLVDYSVFEVHPKVEDELLVDCITDLQPQLRALMMVKSGLLHHQLVSAMPARSHIVDDVCRRSGELLLQAAWSPHVSHDMTADDELIALVKQEKAQAQTEGRSETVTEMRLCSSLLYLSLQLRDGVRCSAQKILCAAEEP